MPEETKTPLQAAMDDVTAKTALVTSAKMAVGTVRAEAAKEAKAKVSAARKRLEDAKAALEESRKAFDREVRAATKP